MKQRRAFDQLTLLQLNQPGLVLRAMERAALVPLVRRMLLEILFSGIAYTSNEESDDEQNHA
jgi:hypothetical protein